MARTRKKKMNNNMKTVLSVAVVLMTAACSEYKHLAIENRLAGAVITQARWESDDEQTIYYTTETLAPGQSDASIELYDEDLGKEGRVFIEIDVRGRRVEVVLDKRVLLKKKDKETRVRIDEETAVTSVLLAE